MAPIHDIFTGQTKRDILAALHAAGAPVAAADLCETVLGGKTDPQRAVLRNLVAQMRPKLQQHGFDIRGRTHLRMNAYHLVNTLLE